VGVASNSHKAIHNLLTEIERIAEERGGAIRGIKKATGGNEESVFQGKFFKNTNSTREIDASFNLVAGTVFMYAELADQLITCSLTKRDRFVWPTR